MFSNSSSQLQPTPEGQRVDISSIGRTNKLHSEEEELYIRNVLLAAESLLQSEIVDDGLQRWETVDLIGRCKIALAPQLLPDVLGSIFHSCGETRVQFPLGGIDQDLRLLSITHVCSAWRQLALEMPALWSNIGVHLSKDADLEQHNKTLSSARQWFNRAQGMRRSLFIHFNAGWNANLNPHLQDTWKKLLEFMAQYRLGELDLICPMNHVALKVPDHVWPSIERLHLKPSDGGRESVGQQLFSNFAKLSNLRYLKISNFYNLDGVYPIVPWHQLRTFEGGPVTPSWCLYALRQSRLLERCCITLSKESITSPVVSKEERIVLTNIDYLTAEFQHALWVSMFLRPLFMPNITTFKLSLSRDGFEEKLIYQMSALIGIIQRSGGMRRIRRLEIGPTSEVLDIGTLLELLPSLESISIEDGLLSDDSVRRLSSGKLGPRLCNIYLNILHDADQILSMVESRHQNTLDSEDTPCPFKSISIPCETTLQESSCRNDRIKLLSEKCHASISLDVKVRYRFRTDRY